MWAEQGQGSKPKDPAGVDENFADQPLQLCDGVSLRLGASGQGGKEPTAVLRHCARIGLCSCPTHLVS